jgi:glutamine cyclotransferase
VPDVYRFTRRGYQPKRSGCREDPQIRFEIMNVKPCCSLLVVTLAVVSQPLEPRPAASSAQSAAADGYRVVNAYPHDPDAFTQGLIFRNGFLFESTGQYGRSTLRKVELTTGRVVQQHRLDPVYFGEGLTEWNGQLVQLTWRSQIAFVYDLVSFAPRRMFGYSGEGWGLTHNQQEFVLSDGSEFLRFLNPNTFRETRRVTVRDGSVPIKDLNELEYVRGEIYANVWHTDRIARISPQSGQVIRWIDLRGLMSVAYKLDPEAVLNGIAYDAANNRLFVTGKLWPRLFEIQVVPRR